MTGTPWSDARDRLRSDLTLTLERDRRVTGVGLVGSFGRGEADEWSDLDLLVVVGDVRAWTARNDAWTNAEVVVPAPQNTRATAASAGTLHVVDGWPVGVDWYVYPAGEAAWPLDCVVLFGEACAARSHLAFDEWNALGPRGAPHTFSDDELTSAHLTMVPITAKQIARGEAPATQLDDLERFVRRAAPPNLCDPLLRHLDEVRRHIGEDGSPHVAT